jgi:hypothetical protein
MKPRPHRAGRLASTALIALLALLGVLAPEATAAPGQAGHINVFRNATSSFDNYTSAATPAQQQWIRDHYYRMRGYPPFFDQALRWAPPTEFYKDLYAIYSDDQTLASQHPDWVLRDGSGNKLYIPWACNGTSCTQFAGDVGNPAFRQYWIDQAKTQVAKGYKGIFIDDVNMEMRVGNGAGNFVRPMDPRTGQPMTDSDWRRYVAEFTEQIRAQIPGVTITHNALWWVNQEDPFVQREIDSADVIDLERGANDSGLVGGDGTYGYETFLAHIDWLHARGKSVIFAPELSTPAQRQYEIASYFLVSNGTDAISSSYQSDPDNWWSGWETDLGAAQGSRYRWNGLLRRDFAGGFVLVNEPGASQKTVSLGGGFKDLDGNSVESVTLGARQGAVLVGSSNPSDGSTQITGLVKPGRHARVVLRIQRRESGRWVLARTTNVPTNHHGRFKKRIHRLRVGRYRATAHSVGRRNARAVLRHHRRFVIRR